MESEHQQVLDGFGSHSPDGPVEEAGTPTKEAVAFGPDELPGNPADGWLSTEDEDHVDDYQESQERGDQVAQDYARSEGELDGHDLQVSDENMEFPISAWAELSPDMSPEQLRLLVEDVKRRGIIDPPDVLDGQVVDGRKREAARKTAGTQTRYNILPEETNVVRHLLSKHEMRGHYDENQRAVYGYRLYIKQFIEAGLDPEESSANLRNFFSQEEITEGLGVSPRTMSSVSAVLSSRRTSCVSLKDAVLANSIKASDAESILGEPEEIQERAVAMALAGESTTVKRAVERIKQEIAPDDMTEAVPAPSTAVGGGPIALHQATVSDLIGLVEPESLDCIVTFPSPDPSMRERLCHLAEFAVHGLKKATGVMAILTTGQYVAPVLHLLNHPELVWVFEMNYRPPVAIGSAPPHRIMMTRMPLLLFGLGGFRLQGGDDEIKVPPADDSDTGNRPDARLDAGMELIVERLTSPGQVVCDPLMLHRYHSAAAAWKTGRTFIGATDSEANLRRIRNRLAASGIPSI